MNVRYVLPEKASWSSLKECPLRFLTSNSTGNAYQYQVDIISAWNRGVMTDLINKCGNSAALECDHEHFNPEHLQQQCVERIKQEF